MNNNFRPGNRFGGGNRFKRPSFGRDRDFGGDKQMFSVVCSNCGKDAQVPFKPNGRKPVLCSECFGREKSAGNRGDFQSEQHSYGDPNSTRSNYQERSEYRPKPAAPAPNINQFKQDIQNINFKLDKIIRLLTPEFPVNATKLQEKELQAKIKESAKKVAKIKEVPVAPVESDGLGMDEIIEETIS